MTHDRIAARSVQTRVNYIGAMSARPRYHANDHSRDVLELEAHAIQVTDARGLRPAPSLAREGFVLVEHESAVEDFRDRDQVAERHPAEIERLLRDLSGADAASQDLFPYIFDAMSAFPVFRSTGTETLIGVALR